MDWNIFYVLPPLQRLKGSVRVGITRIYFMFIDVLERYKQRCALLFHPKTKPFESDMYNMFSVPNVIAVEII